MQVLSPFLLMVLFFLASVMATLARADVLEIPYNKEFDRARFPYAQVVDDCGKWRQPLNFSDVWGPVDFRTACQQHDTCFHTLGRSFSECNIEYHKNLQRACHRDLKRARLASGRTGDPNPEALRLCLDIGTMFYRKSQSRQALRVYRSAQDRQVGYFRYLSRIIEDTYETSMGRKPSTEEKKAALQGLAQGVSLGTLKNSLESRKLADDTRASARSLVNYTD